MRSWKWVVAAGLALASAAAWAASSNYTPGAGITGTPHDWSAPVSADGSSGGQSLLVWQAGADASKTSTYKGTVYNTPALGADGKQLVQRVQFGLCTRCHTPHQAKTTNLLWNHTLPSATFSWDTPATTAGTTYPTIKGDTYRGGTTKCLSCHDGTMASTDGIWFNRQMVYGSKYVGSGQDSGHDVATGSTGNFSGSHPVAMPYPFNRAANTYNFVTSGSQTTWAEFAADPTGSGIRLYNDNGAGHITAGAVAGKTGMECASCHDIHNGATVQDKILLRGKMAGGKADGYICTKCHNK